MDIAAFLVIVLIGLLISYIWLIARAVQSKGDIRQLNERVDQLQRELMQVVRRQHESPITAKHAEPVSAPIESQPVVPHESVQPVDTLESFTPTAPVEVPPLLHPEPPYRPEEKFEPEPVAVPSSWVVPPVMADVKAPLAEPLEPVFEQTTEPESAKPPPINSLPTTPVKEKGSFEMRLGTYWLVRIGIVMLLTGVVFFGNYAYHNFIPKLGPDGKVGLLYVASFLLLGAGAWWQRKTAKEALRNYGQVLFAGGLAAVYFTTYVAYHIPALRVIPNAILDGALLLGWAGFIVWIADRKKSEVLALFAVVLAYYSSAITTVGAFTLYSNLVLTLVAVVFLVRHRWAALTFASLVATYAGYAFWLFFHHGEWHWATPEQGLWFGTYFLVSYWIAFTAAVFLSKNEKLIGSNRAGFATLNNGAFFSLFLLTMLQVHTGGFWKFSLAYGTILLVCAEISRRVLPREPFARNSYITQGLLLVTIGFIAKYSGFQLALVLGAESVVLYVLGSQRPSLTMKIFSYATAAMAVGWACATMERFEAKGLWVGTAVGVFCAVNAFLSHRQHRERKEPLRLEPTYFTVLAMVMWGVTTWFNTTAEWQPIVFGLEAVVLTFSVYLLGIREIVFFAQFMLLLGYGGWLTQYFDGPKLPPWWSPMSLVVMALMLSHWWQRQRKVMLERAVGVLYQAFYAVGIVLLVYIWLQPQNAAPQWLAVTSALAMGITAYGVMTRAWPLAIAGQAFLVVSLYHFFAQLWQSKPDWYFPLAPMVALGFLSFATMRWFAAKPDSKADVRDPLLKLAMGYRWMALALSLCWIQQYVHESERVWVSMALGLGIFLFAGWRRSREAILFGAVYSGAALVNLAFLPGEVWLYLPNLLALMVFLAQQQIARRVPERFAVKEGAQTTVVLLGSLGLWRMVWCWIEYHHHETYLTGGWSLLAMALLATGVLLHERAYGWAGLAAIAAALVKLWRSPREEWLLLMNLLPVALLLVQQQLSRRWPKRFAVDEKADGVKIVIGSVTLWRFVSCWVTQSQSGFYLTASWSAVALVLFAVGIILGERIYRWVGLGILASALGRVVIFDVWKQETIYRVLTFMALGVVLLALGFLYNKYQDKIRKWL